MSRNISKSEQNTDGASTETDDRTVANAKGALDVVRTASVTVDEEIETINGRASEQVADAEWVVEEISTLSATIEEIAATTNEVSEQSDRAARETAEGRAAAQDAIETMDDVRAVSEAVADEVEALRDRIDRIADALAGIDHIADQTNMLALNASIEAAHTDTEADGFAVVADEIKQLAAESQEQADEIDSALDAVREATDQTVDQLETASDEIDSGAQQVAEAMASLDAVADTVAETADSVTSVSDATDDQAATSEAIAQRCETLAERANSIESDIASIKDARSEQTAMLGEIDDVLNTIQANRQTNIQTQNTLDTGVPGLDKACDGGLIVGGQTVVQHEPEVSVDGLIAQLCATALASGNAVSLTPPPDLDRSTLADAIADAGYSIADALADDQLFILDPFGNWQSEYNVFDLTNSSLSDANATTIKRRDRRLLVIGNIEGEIRAIGEQAAREARYENDDGVFEPDDTVLNVVSEAEVPEMLAAFYTGSADQVVTFGDDREEYVEVEILGQTTRYQIERLRNPPYLRVRS